jgi:hypothetical protein
MSGQNDWIITNAIQQMASIRPTTASVGEALDYVD